MDLPNPLPPSRAITPAPRLGRDCWSDGLSRFVRVRHLTCYRYTTPVRHSEHWAHLRPVHDWRQRLHSYKLRISPAADVVEFDDVFGNFASRFTVITPYTELCVESESVVELIDIDPFAFARKAMERPKFPIAWMPWERTMLAPYLTPEELPPTQLRTLYDYAMSFVSDNKGDIMETLFHINLEMFRNYKYVPGSTSLATSPFRVMTSRTGVCQDFTNLFITMARLLGIPARYVMGYIYTGNCGTQREGARAGSDASHAWVQLYIPDIGWKGFDPTNGVLPQQDHIRVAVGRHYRDTAPTTGTIFEGGGGETMKVDVEVEDALDPAISLAKI
jgi:transglutaminase-like putative cysteine protease